MAPVTPPAPVQHVVTEYLRALDAAVPGAVEGLYLIGSVAMGDFQTGRGIARLGPTGASVSDIDFIAVTSRPLDTAAIRALHRIHRRLAAPWRPALEGIYLTRGDLAHDPGEVRGRPHSHGGRVTTGGSGDPVRWQEFAQHGIAVRGRHRSAVPVRIDRERLVSWNRGNLNQYWRQWHASCTRPLSWPGVVSLTAWASVWGVLGVSRLHYTLRTGRICSKSSGGHYARHQFGPQWHPLLQECLRIRAGLPGPSLYTTAAARRQDALTFVQMVIDDGLQAAVRT